MSSSQSPLFVTPGLARQVLLEQRAHFMRSHPTPSEALLWSQLRGRRLGVQFRRQVGAHSVDFCGPSVRLIVEVDGDRYHAERAAVDGRRDAKLVAAGYRVLRLLASLVERRVGMRPARCGRLWWLLEAESRPRGPAPAVPDRRKLSEDPSVEQLGTTVAMTEDESILEGDEEPNHSSRAQVCLLVAGVLLGVVASRVATRGSMDEWDLGIFLLGIWLARYAYDASNLSELGQRIQGLEVALLLRRAIAEQTHKLTRRGATKRPTLGKFASRTSAGG